MQIQRDDNAELSDLTQQSSGDADAALPDLLELYISDLPEIDISRSEERKLVHLIQRGEQARWCLLDDPPVDLHNRQRLRIMVACGDCAWRRLSTAHLRLGIKVAFNRRFHRSRLTLMDRIQICNRTILSEARRFSPDLDIRFSTYLWWRLIKAIKRAEAEDRRQAGYQPVQSARRKRNRRGHNVHQEATKNYGTA